MDVRAALPRALGHAALEDDGVGVEVGNVLDGDAQLGEGDAPPPVDVEHPDEDVVDLRGDGQDGREEVHGIVQVGLECRVGD